MLLVNAIYFKGLWRYPFNESHTKDDVFQVTPTRSVKVPFMTMERDLYWAESVELDSAVLRLPYMVSAGQCNTECSAWWVLDNPTVRLSYKVSVGQCNTECPAWCVLDNPTVRLSYMVSVGQPNTETVLRGGCCTTQN
jgi:hypothetical protein